MVVVVVVVVEAGRSVVVVTGGSSEVVVGTEDTAGLVEVVEAEESLQGLSSERGLGWRDFPPVGLLPPLPPPPEVQPLESLHS